MTKTTVFRDPDTGILWRYCTGYCERALSLYENFYLGSRGYYDTRCKDCKRVDQRTPRRRAACRKRWRVRYHTDEAYRRKTLDRCLKNQAKRRAERRAA